MADEPVVKWEPEAKPDPKEGRRWGRAVAVVLAPIAVLLLGLRAMANLQDASSYETGYVVGQLLTGPILGAIIWGLIVFMRRRSGRAERFLSSGLVAWMAAVAIVTWFSSVLSSVSR
jgi:hypothetical protein